MIKTARQRMVSAARLGKFLAPMLILYALAFLYPMGSFGSLYHALVKKGYNAANTYSVDIYVYVVTPAYFLFALYLILMAVLAKRFYKLSDKDIGWTAPQRPWKILAAIGITPVFYAFQAACFILQMRLHLHHWIGYPPHPNIVFRRPGDPANWLDFAFIVLLSPLAEEILDRGVVQTLLKIKLGRGPAVAATAILFVLAHLAYRAGAIYHNPWLLLNYLEGGLFFGILKEWDGSLWSPILAHQVFNLIGLRFG
jgi:membrane protease YdiL (CAAX protease family)